MADLANALQNTLPKHLEPFCQPTAGSVMKLLAAWDGLSTETLLCLLEEIKDREIPADLKNHIFKKAFQSDNPYLRYLGYKYTDKWGDTKELEEQAENDPDPLVRSTVYETRPSFLNKEINNPELFFGLSQEIRLAIIRGHVAWTDINGETGEDSTFVRVSFEKNITEIIQYGVEQALPQQKISEPELGDLIREIFLTPTKTAFRSNGDIKFSSLWKTVSAAPDFTVAFFLKALPAKGAEVLTENEIKSMLPWQIKTLFWRSDVELNDLRKKYLLSWQEGDEDSEEIAELAATNLALTDDEFTNLLSMPDITKEKILRNLANRGEALCLHQHAAACEVVGTSFIAEEIFDKRLLKLQRGRFHKAREEYIQYRIYMQACQICSRYAADTEAGQLPIELRKHLSKQVVRRDAWATYLAFKNSDIWRTDPKLINFLPGDEVSWILEPKDRL